MSDDEPNGGAGSTLEEIPREECLRLLASQPVGRVAVGDFGAAPLVVPVNFIVDGEAVVFRTDYGTKFRLAVLGEHPVTFEVDAIEPGRPAGWSVVVQGIATEVDEPQWDRVPVRPWAPGEKGHWVRIAAESVTGRRIRLRPFPGADSGGYL